MEANDDKQFKRIIIVLLAIIICGIFIIFNDINTGYTVYDNDDGAIAEMNENMEELQDQIKNMESQLSKQNSLLDSYRVDCVDCDLHTLKGNILAKIRLKKYTDDTKVTLIIGDKSTDLKLKNGVFQGKINVDITEIYDAFTVSINENGSHLSESVLDISYSDEDIGNIDWELFLVEQGNESMMHSMEENDAYTIEPTKYELKIPSGNKVKENPVFYIDAGKKNVVKKEMSYDANKQCFQFCLDEGIDIDNGDSYKIYAQYTLNTGETLRYIYQYWDDDEGESGEQAVELTDKNGDSIEFEYMD